MTNNPKDARFRNNNANGQNTNQVKDQETAAIVNENSNQQPQAEQVKSRGGRTQTSLTNGLTAETGTKVPLDVNDPKFQDKLFELNWYLGIANAVMVPAKKNINAMENGKVVSKQIEVKVFSHYEYMNVNGLSFENWVKNTFGEEYLVDDTNNQIYTIKPKEAEQPTPSPNTNDPEVDNPQPQA